MRWTIWLLFLVAMAGLTAVGVMVSRQTQSTPEDFFRAVQQRIAEGRYDKEQSLANLDIALEGAIGAKHDALEAEIRLARGRMLLSLGAFERARTDLERLLELRRGDRAIEQLLVEIDVRSGNLTAGIGRVERMRAADPSWVQGTAVLGDLHRRAAARALNAANEVLDKSLVTEESERAKALLARSAGWDPDDPRRIALLHELRPFFATNAEIDYDRAREASLSASQHMASARTILAQSLSEHFDPNAFLSLLDLLKRADQADAAADLAAAALRIPSVRAHEATFTFLMKELERTGRKRYASDLAMQWTGSRQGGSAELWGEVCRALYREVKGRPLAFAALKLKAAGDPASADFYTGIAKVAAGESSDGRFALQRFLAADARPPVPDAVAVAWREIAHACRDSVPPDMVAEREALEGAVAADPEGDGMAWLRLARLQYGSARGGLVQPGLRWARGMSLLPKQTEALMPTWRELGERELAASGVDVAIVRQSIADGKAWAPVEDESPYELFTLAQLYKEAGQLDNAAQYCRRLRSLVPNFLPAVELNFELAQSLGHAREAIGLYLKRLELVGPDEKGDEFLRQIPLDSLTYTDLLTLMRHDPEHAGRFYVARTLAAAGERTRALAILERAGVESLGRDAVRLAAKLHLELGEPERALELLVPIARSLRAPAEALDTFLEAALGARDHERIEQMAQALSRSRDVDTGSWLELVDRMLAGRSANAAQILLARLDSTPATRSGEVVLRAAAASLLLDQERAFSEFLERAEAFESSGRTELLALFAAAEREDPDELARAAAALRLSELPTTPLASTWIALVAERPEEAQTRIEIALKADANHPLWQLAAAEAARQKSEDWTPPAYFGARAAAQTQLFLTGPEGRRDARRAVCAVLALQNPLTIGWAQKELETMSSESHGDLWPALLASLACQASREWGRAREAAARLCERAPDFGPGWDQSDRIAAELPYEPRVRLLLRLERMEALGELSGTLAERLYDEACQYQLRGELGPALAAARAAADAEPENGEIQRKLGQLYAARGELAASIAAYGRACRLLPPGSDLASTGELIGVLERAHKAEPPAIDRTAELALLDEIASEQPDDPRVAVALARLDLDLAAPNLPLGLTRAYARLSRFRTQHFGRSIESLARGAAKTWAEFLLAVDPAQAEEFVQSELDARPGDLDLWVLQGRVLAAQQKIDQALVPFEFALSLAPDHPVVAQYAWLKASREIPQEDVRRVLAKIGMGPKSVLSPEDLALVRGRFSFTMGGRGMAIAIDALKEIDTAKLDADQWRRYALLYAMALVARGDEKEADLDKVAPLLDSAAPYFTHAWQKDVALALRGLAAQRTVPAR